MFANTPDAKPINEQLVGQLLAEQQPQYCQLELAKTDSGWDNNMFRLGSDLAVRLPKRADAAKLIVNEQRWLPQLGAQVSTQVSAPIFVGQSSDRFPWPWSVCRWIEGQTLRDCPPAQPSQMVQDLAHFLVELHKPAAVEAPANPYRGVSLVSRQWSTLDQIAELGTAVDGRQVASCWLELVDSPRWEGRPVWLHGDLHPGNIVVDSEKLAGIVDWGDVCSGDPATDLSVAWFVFDQPDRHLFQKYLVGGGYQLSNAMWGRARAWALSLGVAHLRGSEAGSSAARVAAATIEAVLADH